jgi:hypothetical protein
MDVELPADQIGCLISACRPGGGRAVVVHARVESHVVRIRHGRPAQAKRRRRDEPFDSSLRLTCIAFQTSLGLYSLAHDQVKSGSEILPHGINVPATKASAEEYAKSHGKGGKGEGQLELGSGGSDLRVAS